MLLVASGQVDLVIEGRRCNLWIFQALFLWCRRRAVICDGIGGWPGDNGGRANLRQPNHRPKYTCEAFRVSLRIVAGLLIRTADNVAQVL